MNKILITGSCGLVGSESVKFFCEKGFKVYGIDNNFRRKLFGIDGDTSWVKKILKKKYKNYYHLDIDIRNKNTLEKIFKKLNTKLKLIIHAAAQPSHDWAKSNINIDFEINALGTLNLLTLCHKYSPKCTFIFMSTNKVYGNNPNKLKFIEKKNRYEIKKNNKYFGGIDETMSIDANIHSFFGVSKTYSDLLVQEFGKNYDMNTVCFRAGCITGPGHSGAELHGFLSYLVKSAIKNKFYKIIGYKGKQVRDNIHSTDLINCFWEYFKKPRKGEIYNIGGTRYSNCSILEALNIVESLLKIKIKKNFIKKNRVGDHIWYVTEMKKFKKHYPNWKIKYNTKKIIEELVFYLKALK